MLLKLRDWLCDRAGLDPGTFQAWNFPLPKGVGWLHTLGAALLVLFAIQGLTGIGLAMYYSPHPDGAYESLYYIQNELPFGRLVHSLHYYGASAIIVLSLLHLVRAYFQGSYKRPRELTWLLGLVLFNLVLVFELTGALLPWDQKAFFSTQVRTQFPVGVPVVGPLMVRLLRGGDEVGALTLTRFFAIHALLLPAILLPVLGAHLWLVRKKGYTAPGARVGEEGSPTHRYFSGQVLRDAVMVGIVFGGVFLLSLLRPVELEFRANPTDTTYHPRPDWYFLFLFQFLNEFGKLPVIGQLPDWIPALVLPGVAMTFLALAPWIDRSPERRTARRPLMIGVMAVGLLGVVGLTLRAFATLEPNATPSHSLYASFTEDGKRALDPLQVEAGRVAFETSRPVPCSACHAAYGEGQSSAPDLTGYGMTNFLAEIPGRPEAEGLSHYERFVQYIRGDLRPDDTKMPKYPVEMLSNEELDAIGAYLSQDPARAARRSDQE